jgi:hypothetical protein
VRAVIIADSPRWALHLQLSGWLAHEWANASKEQGRLWNANKATPWRWSIKEGGTYISKKGKMHCISSNFTGIAYLFCRYFKKQNSHWDPTRLTWIEVLVNHIKYGNSTKAKFINEDKKDGFLFMEKRVYKYKC